MKRRRILIPVVGIVAAAVLAVAGGWFALGNVADAQTDLTAPANVRAVQGSAIGQAVVSWDAVAGATGYTVRWVDLDAAWAAYETDGRWGHLIDSESVGASGDGRHSLNIPNLKTNTTRGHGFAVRSERDGAVSGWSDWVILRLTVEVDFEAAVEVLAAALAISKHANALVGEPLPTSQADFPGYRATITANISALDQQVQALSGKGHAARVQQIGTLVNRLKANTALILRDRPALLTLLGNQVTETLKLVTANQATLFPRSEESVDGEFGALMDAGSLSEADRLRYSHLQSLAANVPLAHTLLLVAGRLQDPVVVARNQESYETVAETIRRDIEYLESNRGLNLRPKVLPVAKKLLAAGEDYFNRLEERLELTAVENDRIAANTATLDRLVCEIDGLTNTVQGRSAEPCPMPEPAVGTPGVTTDTITFGQSAALTGPSAALGQGMRLGIEAAFAEANAGGGVGGRQLKLTTKDDGYEPDRAFTVTRQLIDDEQVFALIGAVGTPTTRAALPLAAADDVPFVGAFTGAQLVREGDQDFVLNLRASYHNETEKMVAYLEGMGKTKVAVLYQRDSYGGDGLAGVKKALESRPGMDLTASWSYRRNTNAVEGAAYRIARAEPDAVIIIGAYAPTAEFIKQLRLRLMDDPIFMAVSFVGSNALAQQLQSDNDSLENIYVTQVTPLPSDVSHAAVARYQTALRARDSSAAPGFVSLEGYLAGRLAIAALEGCGAEVTRQCFLKAAQDAGTISLDGFNLMFGPMDNQGSDAVFLTQISPDGNYQVVE